VDHGDDLREQNEQDTSVTALTEPTVKMIRDAL
jgi:hypothetical protein